MQSKRTVTRSYRTHRRWQCMQQWKKKETYLCMKEMEREKAQTEVGKASAREREEKTNNITHTPQNLESLI